jgi:hypothetical protein
VARVLPRSRVSAEAFTRELAALLADEPLAARAQAMAARMRAGAGRGRRGRRHRGAAAQERTRFAGGVIRLSVSRSACITARVTSGIAVA